MAVTIQVISGGGQSAYTDTQFPDPIRIRLMDGGSALAFTSVEFGVPDQAWPSGKWASGTQYIYVTTDNQGYATSDSFRANNLQGSWYGTLNAVGATQVTFLATNLVRTPPVPTTITVSSGNNQKQVPGAVYAQAFAVRVQDQYGDNMVGTNVFFGNPAGYGSYATGAASQTNASGVATASAFTAGATLGQFNITATSSGAAVSGFIATNVDPAIATGIVVVSGQAQQAGASQAFTNPLVARVVNGGGGGIAGKSVTFTAPGSAATCTFPGPASAQTVTSDGSGNATSGQITASATNGSYNVVCSSPGLASVNFGLSNITAYLPEVCLAYSNPGGSANFGSGVNGVAWSAPASAIGNPGSTSVYATSVQTGAGNRSPHLLFTPKPTSWGTLLSNARITQLSIKAYVRGVPGSGTLGSLLLSFLRNGTVKTDYSLLPWTGWSNGVFTQIAATHTPPATGVNAITVADLSLANTGFGIANAPVAGTVAGSGFNINGVTVTVCYQDVNTGQIVAMDLPLLLCEA